MYTILCNKKKSPPNTMLLTVPVLKPRTFTFLFVLRPYNGLTKIQIFYSFGYEKLEYDQFHTFFCLFSFFSTIIWLIKYVSFVFASYESTTVWQKQNRWTRVWSTCPVSTPSKLQKKLLSDYCGLVQYTKIGWFHFKRRSYIFKTKINIQKYTNSIWGASWGI